MHHRMCHKAGVSCDMYHHRVCITVSATITVHIIKAYYYLLQMNSLQRPDQKLLWPAIGPLKDRQNKCYKQRVGVGLSSSLG